MILLGIIDVNDLSWGFFVRFPHGTSKNKIYDSELFMKKKGKIDQLTPKAQRKIFFTYEFGPTTTKKLIFLSFFYKKFCLFD